MANYDDVGVLWGLVISKIILQFSFTHYDDVVVNDMAN